MDKGQPTKWPGVTKLPTGEYLVRVREKIRSTGKPGDVARKLPPGSTPRDFEETRRSLQEALNPTAPDPGRVRFREYARKVMEGREARGTIQSPATKARYRVELELHLMPKWGDMFIDQIARHAVKDWLGELGKLVLAKKTCGCPRTRSTERCGHGATPETVNGWWRTFKGIMSEASIDFDLKDPTRKLESIPRSAGPRTYTVEEPNSLRPDELPAFFRVAFQYRPRWFAMIALGLITGRRPCELRPLRRSGARPDMDWATGALQIRRSFVYGAPMEMTKQKKDVILYTAATPLYDVLQWHVAQLRAEQIESELFFPPLRAHDTGFMHHSALDGPVKAICAAAGIKKHITPRFMRRTYQDLCEAAGVSDRVKLAMSGHATEEMAAHYSTVADTEGRAALIKMSDIAGLKEAARLT